MKAIVEVKFEFPDRIILTNWKGDTLSSRSEELFDFFHDAAESTELEPTTTPINSTSANTDLKQKLAYHFGYKSFSEMDTREQSTAEWMEENQK